MAHHTTVLQTLFRVRPRTRLWLLIGLLLSCSSNFALAAKPQHVLSLNLCTDQLLMQLADRKAIAGLTSLATDDDLSAHAHYATELPQHHGSVEEIIRINPDLVLAGSMTTRSTVAILKRFGFRIVTMDIPSSIEEMRDNVRLIAASLGEAERGESALQAMDQRLIELRQDLDPLWQPVAAVYYANGFSVGKNSVVGEIFELAGYRNLSATIGHRSFGRLELETLLLAKPDLIILGNFAKHRQSIAQEVLKHPAFNRLVDKQIDDYHAITSIVPGNLWMCATPTIVKAVEILINDREKLSRVP